MANHIFPSTFFGSSGIRPSHDVVKERQYETFEFNNWQRVKWAKLKYNVWSNCLFKHFTLYKHICFRLLLTSYWLLLLSSSRTVSSLAFNYIHWRVSETSLIHPPLSLTCIRSMKPLIWRAVLVQSHWRTLIIWSFIYTPQRLLWILRV